MMVVISLEKPPAALRGELTRWLLELKPNLYVGTLTARVKDALWEKILAHKKKHKMSAAIQIWTSNNEQGFEIRSTGFPTYEPRDFEGLTLIQKPRM